MPGKLAVSGLEVRNDNQALEGWFDRLSDAALIKLERIINTRGNSYPLVDASRSTWWRWVAAGKAPEPVRPTAGTTFWRVGDLREWLRDPVSYTKKLHHARNSRVIANQIGEGAENLIGAASYARKQHRKHKLNKRVNSSELEDV